MDTTFTSPADGTVQLDIWFKLSKFDYGVYFSKFLDESTSINSFACQGYRHCKVYQGEHCMLPLLSTLPQMAQLDAFLNSFLKPVCQFY